MFNRNTSKFIAFTIRKFREFRFLNNAIFIHSLICVGVFLEKYVGVFILLCNIESDTG